VCEGSLRLAAQAASDVTLPLFHASCAPLALPWITGPL
jgi:hypothetical protein